MSDTARPSPLKQAYAALEILQAKLLASEQAQREPIAIVGIGCRLPGGADSPAAYWRLLCDGIDATREVPAERWHADSVYDPDADVPGKAYARRAGFLQEPVDTFDAEFFGIAPREARGLDPQQRLLLEVVWEALEHAGQAPAALKGSRTAVFIGIASNDYAALQIQRNDRAQLDLYSASGIAHSIAAGRISYLLGLQGPCVSLDTACSSSLVAVHLAVQSLRSRECAMALAGGVNLILGPENMIAFSKARMLAPDGRCKTFDARADGFADGEGCGVVVLKRLSDALLNRDRVLAVIRGSAINQDGASSGLTVPNGPAQEALIRDALRNASVAPHEVGYIEAHGTGTSLGDPIEVQALGAVLGEGRAADQPFLLGAAKASIGHLEAAAGIAGLIKVALMLDQGAVPPQLHFETPNPMIPWDEINARVVTQLTPWPAGAGARIAGVSSFGFSGTNAHIVLGGAPGAPAAAAVATLARPLHLLTLSAQSEPALRALAGRHAQRLGTLGDAQLGDYAFTANTGRSHFSNRLALPATNAAAAAQSLAAFAAAEPAAGVVAGEVTNVDRPRIAFLFTGQGAQYAGMGRGLYDTQPVFRDALERCAAVLDDELGRPLLPLMFGSGEDLNQTAWTQPALFALEYALAQMWRSWGVTPSVVLGHSVGEYAAACVAGVMSLEDGLRLIAARGRLMQALPAGGAMLSLACDAAAARAALVPHAALASIAALNTPSEVVVSGDAAALRAISERLAQDGIRATPLRVSHAFHSPLMEPMLDDFERLAATVEWHAPQVRLISNLTGQPASPALLADAGYWRRHVREPVRFADSIASAHQLGATLFLELGPGGTLTAMGQRCGGGGEDDRRPVWVSSLRANRPEWPELMAALAAVYVGGAPIDWNGFDQPYGRARLALPTYPFERRRYWLEAARPGRGAPSARGTGHPLLGNRLRSPLPSVVFENTLRASELELLDDHRIHGAAVLPGTAYIEMALAAGRSAHGLAAAAIDDLTIREPLVVRDGEARTVQLILEKDGTVLIASAASGDAVDGDAWTQHATGRVRAAAARPAPADLDAIRTRCQETVTAAAHNESLQQLGLAFGPSLRGVREIVRRRAGAEGEALGSIELPLADDPAFAINPALLDACVQVVAAACGPDGRLYLPLNIGSVEWFERPGTRVFSHVLLRGAGGEGMTGDVSVYDERGRCLARLHAIHFRSVETAALQAALSASGPALEDSQYTLEWRAQEYADAAGGAAAQLPAPPLLAAAAAQHAAPLARRHGLADWQSEFARLEAAGLGHVVAALLELGWAAALGARVDAAALAAQLGVVPRYHRLLARLLEILAEGGFLARSDSGWEVRRALAPLAYEPPAASSAAGALLGRCGPRLAAVLRGAADPLELLFPGGSLADAQRLYLEAPLAQVCNGLAAELVAAAAAAMPAGRRLRVLEVGGGTGGTTASILARAGAALDYTFTDVSPFFTAQAQERFASQDRLRCQPFDLEQDGEAQGLVAGSFDVIVAANVVHATRDLRQTLARLHRMLAPQGLLLLVEVTARQRWIDLTFGLTDGWWHFTDAGLRADYPLLSREQWLALLATEGFAEPAVLPEFSSAADPLSHNALLIARRDSQRVPGWLLLGEAGVAAERLAEALAARGEASVLVSRGAEFQDQSAAAFEALLKAGAPAGGWRNVVLLWNFAKPADRDVDAAVRGAAGSVLMLAQALARGAAGAASRLWLVTRGAQALVPGERVAPAQASVWGLARTIGLEFPELRCSCIDLGPSPAGGEVSDLARELTAVLTRREEQVALRHGARFVARLARLDAGARAGEVVKLAGSPSGSLDDLRLVPAARRAPGPGEVEIEVRAAGLNFRDVLNALAMRADSEPLGSECSGEVVAVGSGVTNVACGEQVVAIAPGSFGSHVIAAAAHVARKPQNLTHAEAATLSLAFLTAEYALLQVGQLRRGQRILIHAAAGGVGLAALQLAQRAGAVVFATAGSAEKRDFLRGLGVQHVFDSRSLSFAAQVRAAGGAMDVVLNSLTGEFIPQSLALLGAGGRFLEIGKRELLTPAEAARLAPQAVYHAVDLTPEVTSDSDWFRGAWARLLADAAAGRLLPLPAQVFPLAQVADAFRYMAQARHLGKVVVSRAAGARAGTPLVRPDATYLVTGGLSGLGLLSAQWLAEQGARHLVLMGRGEPSADAQAAIERLRSGSVRVTAVRADVSVRGDVERVLGGITAGAAPLRGIVHSAGVLDDGMLLHQDWQRFATVLAPKVTGTALLHELTAGAALDFFVLYSSVAALLGSRGQSNHSAANAWMDALAHQRRALGLCALTINWGGWAKVGAVVGHAVGEGIVARGLGLIEPRAGLAALGRLMRQEAAQVAVLPVNWRVFRGQFAAQNHNDDEPAWLAEIADAAVVAGPAAPAAASRVDAAAGLSAEIAAAPQAQRRRLIVNYVALQVARVLRRDAAEPLNHRRPLNELGLDSLMAVELRNLLAAGLALPRSLPATLVFDQPTVAALADYLAAELAPPAATVPPAVAPPAGDALDAIEDLSSEEVDRLFEERMKATRSGA